VPSRSQDSAAQRTTASISSRLYKSWQRAAVSIGRASGPFAAVRTRTAGHALMVLGAILRDAH
jgi:hypothetical protein